MIAASIDDRDDDDDDQKHNAFNEDACLGGSVGVDVQVDVCQKSASGLSEMYLNG